MSREALIFDMDGVLIDSEPLHARVLQQVAAARGIPLSLEDTSRFVGFPDDRTWQIICRESGMVAAVPELLEEQRQATLTAFAENSIEAIAGVTELLQELRARGIATAVTSSSESELVDLILERLGLLPFFPLRVGRDQVAKGKPEPDLYQRTLALLGINCSEAVAIEDSLPGIEAAQRAGIYTVLYRASVDTVQGARVGDLEIADFVPATRGRLLKLFSASTLTD